MDSKKPQYRAVKTKLGEILKETWNIYSKHFLAFCGLFVLPVVLGIAVQIGIMGGIGINAVVSGGSTTSINIPMIIGGIVAAAVLGWLIQLFGLNTTLRGAYYADTQGKLPFGQAFSEGLQKLGRSAGLSIRVFFYTGVWIIGILGILFGLTILASVMAVQDGGSGFVAMMQPIMGLTGILPIVMLVVIIFLIQRICRATFAFPILLSKDVTSKEALDESIQLADGITGTIFGNYFLFGLMMAIVVSVLNQLLFQIVGMVYPAPQGSSMQEMINYIQNVSQFVGVIPSVLIGSFSMVFQYAFMKKAREEKSEQSGMPQNGTPEAPQAQPNTTTQPVQPTPPVQPAPPIPPSQPTPPPAPPQGGSTFKL